MKPAPVLCKNEEATPLEIEGLVRRAKGADWATTSLALAIASWPLTLFCATGILSALAAIMLGHIAIHRAKHGSTSVCARNRAVNGLIVSYVYIGFATLLIVKIVRGRVSPGISWGDAYMPMCLIWHVVEQVVIVATAALIGAMMAQLVTRIVAKFTPPYAMAYKATLLGCLIGIMAAVVLDVLGVIGLAVGPSGPHITAMAIVRLVVVGFLPQAAIYGTLIKHPSQESLGLAKGCLVSLLQLLVGCLLVMGLLDMGVI
ncbi:MAG TPA: hypothetical protein VLH56_01800 [Dissulfurispiraceae bacterium]|nr:hypothetical protein [Dissulfurispiraceae bacterium]